VKPLSLLPNLEIIEMKLQLGVTLVHSYIPRGCDLLSASVDREMFCKCVKEEARIQQCDLRGISGMLH
jgi:hypothetical protein